MAATPPGEAPRGQLPQPHPQRHAAPSAQGRNSFCPAQLLRPVAPARLAAQDAGQPGPRVGAGTATAAAQPAARTAGGGPLRPVQPAAQAAQDSGGRCVAARAPSQGPVAAAAAPAAAAAEQDAQAPALSRPSGTSVAHGQAALSPHEGVPQHAGTARLARGPERPAPQQPLLAGPSPAGCPGTVPTPARSSKRAALSHPASLCADVAAPAAPAPEGPPQKRCGVLGTALT